MVYTRNIEIRMEEQHCWGCGRWWAHEQCHKSAECPFCAGERVEKAEASATTARRAVATYRGVIRRMKKR